MVQGLTPLPIELSPTLWALGTIIGAVVYCKVLRFFTCGDCCAYSADVARNIGKTVINVRMVMRLRIISLQMNIVFGILIIVIS